MHRPTGRIAALAGAVAVAGLLAFPVVAQEGCVGVQVEPARLASDGESSYEYPVEVRNCSDEVLEVSLSVSGLGHDLDGAPQFFENETAEAALTLSPAPGTFTLGVGKKKVFDAGAVIPEGKKSLYAGIVAEFRRPGVPTGSSVATRTRVAGMLLLRGPKPWKQQVDVVDVTVTPAEDGSYLVRAAVENTGNVHVAPRGTVEIRQGGTLLDTVKLDGGTILPGFKRGLAGTWTPPKNLDGKVKLTAETIDPRARGSATIDFSEGEAGVPAASITSFIASEVDGAPYISVTLQNIGSVPLTPNIELLVQEGEFDRMRQNFPMTEQLAPGANRTIEWTPALGDGTYQITARATQDGALLDERVTGLRIGVLPAPAAEGSSKMLVLIIASILLVAVVAFLLYTMTRRRGSEMPPPPPPPPTPERGWATPEEPAEHPVAVGVANAVADEPVVVLRLRR